MHALILKVFSFFFSIYTWEYIIFFFTDENRYIENKNTPSGYVKLGGVLPLHDFRSSGRDPLRPKCGIASPEDNGEPMEMNWTKSKWPEYQKCHSDRALERLLAI